MNEKEFSVQKPNQINGIYEWLGEKKDSKYSVTEPLCNKKFELAKVIKKYLNITNFNQLAATLKSYEPLKLNETYNHFQSIYSGEAYSLQILKGNDLYEFITSLKQQNESFRSYIIKLCDDTYQKCGKAYKIKFPNLMYADEFNKDLEEIIANTKKTKNINLRKYGPKIYSKNQ